MMYRHTMTVYDDAGALVKTIPDGVDLASFGYPGHAGVSRGAPVEGAVSPDHRYFYVTNYSMYGANFGPEGSDDCSGPGGLSPSFVYRVDLKTLAITGVAQVGMVPKYIAVTPDNRYILVTNWCSFDLSVIDRATFKEVRRIPLGTDPRGIAVNPSSTRRVHRGDGLERHRPRRPRHRSRSAGSGASACRRATSCSTRPAGTSTPRSTATTAVVKLDTDTRRRRRARRRPDRSRAAWRSRPTAPRCTS